MSAPIIDIYMLEDAVEKAALAHWITKGINDPVKQQDDKGLKTPRVEAKFVWKGWGTDKGVHFWIDSSKAKWPDTGTGTLFAKVVTKRGDALQNHSRLVGTVRWLMQSASALSSHMAYHRVEWILESPTVPDFKGDEFQDRTTLSFNVMLSVMFDTKTAQIFPS